MQSREAKPAFPQLLQAAHKLADISAAAILPYFRKSLVVENKDQFGAFDPVTKADKAAERAMLKVLKSDYPDHAIAGEEFGTKSGSSSYQWILDPIDGTRAFITGNPLWGTLIGLADAGVPILGLMNQPFTGERFWSDKSASYLRIGNGKPRRLKTRAIAKLSDAILTTTHPDLFEGASQQQTLAKLKASVRMTRYGGDCYGYCMLAAGHSDLIVEAGLKPYDIAALVPIIERAGGIVTSWDGGPAMNGGNVIAAGDKRIHNAALKLIASQKM